MKLKLLATGMRLLRAASALAFGGLATVCLLSAQQRAAYPLAQKLVSAAQAQHPDVTEVGIELPQAKTCHTIASTDPGDVGGVCESDDIVPLKTGKPAVAKETDGFDVSVLLHDANGTQIGVLGIEMKLAGHTRATALREALAIEKAMAARIPSKAALAGR